MFKPFESRYYDPSKPLAIILFVVMFVFAAAGGAEAQDGSDDTDSAVAVFNRGQDAHEKGDLKTAIELYQKALTIVPEFPEAELQLGNALQTSGRLDEAESAFRKAVELRAEWPLAITNLGSLLVTKGRYAEAASLLSKAIELDGQNFVALSAMTELLLRTNAQPTELQALLNRVKMLTGKANPTAGLWAARGSLERALGDPAASKKSLAEALAIDPKNKAALFEKADIALKENDAAQAEETAKTLETLTGNSERAIALHAQALFNAGKTDEARKLIDSIQNPGKEILELKAAMATFGSENATDLEGRLASDPKNASVLERLCSLYRVSDPTKALDYCRRAAEADPQNIKPAIGYGAALVQAKRYEEAAALFRKLLGFAADNSTIHGNLATALFQLKRYAEAKAEYQWLTGKQPDLPIAYFFLAICHDQLREYLDAMAYYQQFLKLADPEQQKVEIDKVNLRIPTLQQQLKKGAK
jgi:tetratricopeptide (TPR) repeat protein